MTPELRAPSRRSARGTGSSSASAADRAVGVPPQDGHADPGTSARRGRRRAGRPASAGRIPHDFRRTAVRNLERAGVARAVAMELTGHKTEAVYRRYAIVSDADLREAAHKLAAAEHGRVIALGKVLGQVAAASG